LLIEQWQREYNKFIFIATWGVTTACSSDHVDGITEVRTGITVGVDQIGQGQEEV
jgi:hypothetical protein